MCEGKRCEMGGKRRGGCSSITMVIVTSAHPGSNWRKPRGPSCGSPRANRACALALPTFAEARRSLIGFTRLGDGTERSIGLSDRPNRVSSGLAVDRAAVCQRPLAALFLSLETGAAFFLSLPPPFPTFLTQPQSGASAVEPAGASRPGLAPSGPR